MLSAKLTRSVVSTAAWAMVAFVQWSPVCLAQKIPPGKPPPGAPVVVPNKLEPLPEGRVIAEPASAATLPTLTALNFGLSASALSPFSVALSWDAVGNASGYTVFRDGAALAQLPGTSRGFQDNSVAPASRHRYSVQAQLSQPGTRYSRGPSGAADAPTTALLDVELPPVLPPSGVIVKMVGPDTAEISWQPRAGAAGYTLIRNGSPFPIGPQPRPGVYTQYNLPAGTATFALRTAYLRPDGQQVLSDPSPEISLRTGPFRVLAIGDSVMWGQGLRDPSKFKTKVAQWLGAQLGRSVDVTLLARSGAVVELGGSNGRTGPAHGEVPSSFPTIRDQALRLGPQRPADIDLVLVDGCANDLNVSSILNPQINSQQISSLTARFCGEPVRLLLTDIARTYPNSKIVLTGYFPIVSARSDLNAVKAFGAHMGAASPAVAAALGIPLDPLVMTLVGAMAADQYLRHSIANSDTFHAVSTSALLGASTSVNNAFGGNRIEFVPVPFGPNNAYSTPDSYLWLMPTAPINQDEVYAERFASCRAVPPGTDNIKCVEAAAGHPNVRGAQVYADSITARLGKYLPEWRTRFAAVKTAP